MRPMPLTTRLRRTAEFMACGARARGRHVGALCIVAFLSAAGLGASAIAQERTREIYPAETARRGFEALEKKLLEARTVHIDGSITAEGTIAVEMAGSLKLQRGNLVSEWFEGEFAGESRKAFVVSDGKQMRGGDSGGKEFSATTPDALAEALIVGATRMGLLHNIAMLGAGVPPEHSDGGVGDRVRVGEFKWVTDSALDGFLVRHIAFDLFVNDEKSARVEMWVRRENGMPVKRLQVVEFESGEMRVTESYSRFEIDVDLAPSTFKLPEN